MIQAVIFDLGDTLMYSRQPWPAVMMKAGQSLSNWLVGSGVPVNPKTFHLEFLQKLEAYYDERDISLIETTTLLVLKKLLTKKGHRNLPPDTLREALDIFYGVTQANWHLERDAIETLQILQGSNIQIGLISNAGDEPDVLQQVQAFGIKNYFDFIITSAGCGYRKPHPRIFQLALEKWNIPPEQIAMVGDRLEADICGAKNMGMHTIWLKRRAKTLPSSEVTPDYTAENLKAVAKLILENHHS